MQSKYPNHRIWFFINRAKQENKDSIDFYRPVSRLADHKYEQIREELNSMGYIAKDMTNPNGSSLAGLLSISNILKDEPNYEQDNGHLTTEQLEEIQRLADERYFNQTGKHLPNEDARSWKRLL